MSILNVNQIQPVGGGNTITVSASDVSASGVTITASSFVGPVTGNISGGTVDGSTGTFTDDVSIADKIVHTSDTNTAIRFPANDTITAETGGSERVRIISSGEVSIGGFTPTAGDGVLQIAGGLRVAGSASASDTTSPYIYRTSGVDHLNIATNGIKRLTITSAGDMGLGTASPRSITNFGSFAINGTAGSFTDYFLNGTRTGTTAVDSNGFTSEAVGSSTPFRVITNGTEKLRITSAGKVGINQLTPTAFMHVKSGANDGTVISTFEGATNNKLDVKFISSGPAINVTAGDPLVFEIGGSEKLRILSGGGITFNGDTSAANALNDYEEGTWTPTLGGNAGYDIRVGTYTKIGNIVYAYCRIRPTSLGTGSDDTISGLPFNPNGSDNSGVMIGYYDGSAVNSVDLGGVLNSNGSITLYTKTSGVNNTGSTTFFQNNCRIYLSTVYQTDS